MFRIGKRKNVYTIQCQVLIEIIFLKEELILSFYKRFANASNRLRHEKKCEYVLQRKKTSLVKG